MNTNSCSADDYQVEIVAIDSVHPSPENDDIYGPTLDDEQMDALVESIRRRGLEEPIIVSSDSFIISGHRRHHASKRLGWKSIPVRRKRLARSRNLGHWPQILIEYNPQRVKTTSALLKEALLRHADNPAALLQGHQRASIEVDADFIEVSGVKLIRAISGKRQEFLEAAINVVRRMRAYWPLTVRQIHYQLLNDPPLKMTPKRSKHCAEHYRYTNDEASYEALVELLKSARYGGHISMNAIDDPTRPKFTHGGYRNLSHFLEQEMQGFLCGYHRDKQLDQPRHIEVLGEKNTLTGIIKPVCEDYYVPLTLGRGYASLPVWRDMATRFKRSGKTAMTLIIASDYDPEGLDLAKDAIRSLRDLWEIPVDYHRVAINRQQIDELALAEDFNPAKCESSRFQAFVEETGGTKSWELEALPPEYLRNQVRAAIEANMNKAIYEKCIERELQEADELRKIRSEIVGSLNI